MLQTNDVFGGTSITKSVNNIMDIASNKYYEADIWEGSRFEAMRKISIHERGTVAQQICDVFIKYANPKAIIEFMGINKGFSLNVNGVKVAVKSATIDKLGNFTINQVRVNSPFEFLMFVAFYPDTFKLFICKKQDIEYAVDNKMITRQHKGYIKGQKSGIYHTKGKIERLKENLNLEEITI